ncbi:MFS transporter [Streptomyces sp. NRRL F-6492]|uniref:MFS transporter n=1 Tax=Streptomyces sp. NRRL F-6492 TaxID=1519497 RepID=UPI00099D769E|nr:MFS transporter [Streptomyces sp. NRRL F-6492]
MRSFCGPRTAPGRRSCGLRKVPGPVLLPGALADRFGRRRVFRCGLLLFGLASLVCALAPSPGVLDPAPPPH